MYLSQHGWDATTKCMQRKVIREDKNPIFHFTVKQIQAFKKYYDDVKYNNALVTKFILVGHITSMHKAMSPRNLPIMKVAFKDSTGKYENIVVYYEDLNDRQIEQMIKEKLYVKLGCSAKIAGLVYRTEIQVNCNSLNVVQEFDQITLHFMSCMKAELNSS